ncbi:MAG: histidine kinase [Putridiphycobacter sp.]|nr:histidine kinase [Putridiphycobacter sp.]
MGVNKNRNLVLQILSLWVIWIVIRFLLTRAAYELDLFIVQSFYSLIDIAIVVTINVRFLIPKFFTQKKYLFYALLSISTITVSLFFVYSSLLPWGQWYQDYTNLKMSEYRGSDGIHPIKWLPRLAPLIIAFLGSSLIEILKYANKKETEVTQAEKEKLTTELKFLKSQVNPHFLFNALNNIYSLSITKSEETPESIMQLSEILRYMVYDSRENAVLVEDELKYLENFIQLMNLKDSTGLNVTLAADIQVKNMKVAPLLFIPFIENAFKHSKIENDKNGFISIKLETKGNDILFSVKNSVPENSYTKDDIGGIGIANTRKRLEILYPNKHHLKIYEKTAQFEVSLLIQVK